MGTAFTSHEITNFKGNQIYIFTFNAHHSVVKVAFNGIFRDGQKYINYFAQVVD